MQEQLTILALSLYLLFLAFRFISLLMYTIFCTDCLLRHSSSADCQNFTLYHNPYMWKTAWSSLSIANLLLWLPLFIFGFFDDLNPLRFRAVLKALIRRPQFWTSVAQITCASVYDGLIVAENSKAHKQTEVLFIVMKCLTMLMVYQLNFMLPPSSERGYGVLVVGAHNLTLFCFAMDNLSKFSIESAVVVFKVYTFDPKKQHHPMKVLNLMLMIVNASLYAFFWHFLWNKLFCGEKDILTIFRSNFEDTQAVLMHISVPTFRIFRQCFEPQ